jgi:hypothetical protein
VAALLQKVIPVRKAEDTWQLDSYDGASAVLRAPDEVRRLVLLDILNLFMTSLETRLS